MIKNLWRSLDPSKKRYVVIAGGLMTLFAVVSIFSGKPTKNDESRSRQETIRHVITDHNTREIGIDSLSADVKIVTHNNNELRRELESIKQELTKAQTKVSSATEIGREVDRLKQDMQTLTKKFNKDSGAQFAGSNGKADDIAPTSAIPFIDQKLDYKNQASFFQNAPLPHGKNTSITGKDESRETTRTGIQIITHVQKESAAKKTDSNVGDDPFYLPAGAILTGTFLNGMDAPTAQGARKDPFPSTLRIQKEAILPNRFRADVRECFLFVSGYGDLSSERVYLRGETLSCIREDGSAIETTLDSYAVGEDGKTGVRGRLVSKQGQIIAKSMMAGFLSGMSQAFNVNPIPVINTSPGDKTQYQSVFSEDLMRGAAVKGASKALDRIANFYIEMAESIFPVIEVDAGRQIDVIVKSGAKLKIQSAGGKQK